MTDTSIVKEQKPRAQQYVPGVCNIGPAERATRRKSGLIAAAVTLILLLILEVLGVPKGWRLLLFLPASAAATGFLQDAFHFCVGFGMKGLYNVVHSAGITNNVQQEDFRRQDKRKALQIIALSLALGVVFAVLSTLIAI